MQRVRATESHRQSAAARGADQSAPRATPLTLVSGAIAGDDLARVTETVAHALARPVAIAIPAVGAPVVAPPGGLSAEQLDQLLSYARALIAGHDEPPPAAVSDSVTVRIGDEIVGIVAAGPAAAASVTALIREAQNGDSEHPGASLLLELIAGPPEDLTGFLARARRSGVELASGAVALCARRAG